jgi:glycosyl hydrolase family 113
MTNKTSIQTILLLIILLFSQTYTNSEFKKDFIRGMTISCQTWGYEWATPEMKQSLMELKKMGVNSFAIHPYARIQNDGKLKFSKSLEQDHISVPLKWAKELNMKVMLKPHLAYWGSKFSWRGDIKFNNEKEWQLFFTDYKKWIVIQAEIAEKYNADIFCIGVEYKNSLKYENEWREIISIVRKVYSGKLTYGANWDTYSKVSFWDVLDFIGIQAYFPIVNKKNPAEFEIQEGWNSILMQLNKFSKNQNKQIIFTELGYNNSEYAAQEPWSSHESNSKEADITQQRCLKVALKKTSTNQNIAGVFLWKWFPEIEKFRWHENFNLQTPANKKLIADIWNHDTLNMNNNSKLGK